MQNALFTLFLFTTCWSLHGHAHDTLVYVESAYTGKPRISGYRYLGEAGLRPYTRFPNFDDFRLPQGDARSSFSLGTWLSPQLRHLSRLKHRYLAFEERTWHQPIKATYYLHTYLVLTIPLTPTWHLPTSPRPRSRSPWCT